MAKNLTAQEIAAKQVRKAQGAVADYKKGVESVKESPTVKAAREVERWFQGIQESYNNGSFVDGCNDCTVEDWRKPTLEKGASNYAPGVARSEGIIAEFQQQRMDKQKQIDATLNSMPRGDLQQNIQRMVAQATEMSKFKFRKRRR